MRIIDTHCHLEQQEFAHDLEHIIEKANVAGVHIITSAITPDTWARGLEISRKFSNVSLSLGFDPMNTEDIDVAIEEIGRRSDEIVAVGEVGLDYYRERDHAIRKAQEVSFRKAILLAMEIDVPVQVHSRSAGKAALSILISLDASSVHLHAFDGKSSCARIASHDYGYYFSIPPSVVRSSQKQKLVKAIDIERLLLETDSPVLGPDRSVRNEPTNIWIALDEVANILGREQEELRQIILENTLKLYRRIEAY